MSNSSDATDTGVLDIPHTPLFWKQVAYTGYIFRFKNSVERPALKYPTRIRQPNLIVHKHMDWRVLAEEALRKGFETCYGHHLWAIRVDVTTPRPEISADNLRYRCAAVVVRQCIFVPLNTRREWLVQHAKACRFPVLTPPLPPRPPPPLPSRPRFVVKDSTDVQGETTCETQRYGLPVNPLMIENMIDWHTHLGLQLPIDLSYGLGMYRKHT
jgi:hypothetical protein